MDLSTSFDGLTLLNPLMPASGPLVGDLDKLIFMRNQSVGAIVTKTISRQAAVVPRPCIYGNHYLLLNAELWSEHSADYWYEAIMPEFHHSVQPLIISLGYTKEDMAVLVPKFDAYADAFEISTHYVGKDFGPIQETVATIRSLTDKPVYLKVSPHIEDPVAFARAVREAGATGVVAINSLGPTLHIDIDQRAIGYGGKDGFAWTSGPAIKHLALATVYRIKEAMPDFTVIGVGGIQSASDMIEFLLAGADAVQLLSAAMIKGKDIYDRIIQSMPGALKHYGFDSIDAIKKTGLTHNLRYDKKTIHVDRDLCTNCRLCERICPYFAIDYVNGIQINHNKCFDCELCISRCPVHALTSS